MSMFTLYRWITFCGAIVDERLYDIMQLSTKEIGTAQTAIFMREQKPYLTEFSCRRKSYPVECEHSLNWVLHCSLKH